jgi:hypothetical protein
MLEEGRLRDGVHVEAARRRLRVQLERDAAARSPTN